MTESERADRAYGVFQTIARGYDAANERISLGRQRRWKRAAIDGLRLKNTGRGLDLGIGNLGQAGIIPDGAGLGGT